METAWLWELPDNRVGNSSKGVGGGVGASWMIGGELGDGRAGVEALELVWGEVRCDTGSGGVTSRDGSHLEDLGRAPRERKGLPCLEAPEVGKAGHSVSRVADACPDDDEEDRAGERVTALTEDGSCPGAVVRGVVVVDDRGLVNEDVGVGLDGLVDVLVL